jgi:hypothetical protein
MGLDMTEEEQDFLRNEFKVNWDHLNYNEERRYKIFQYYSAFLGISVTVSATVLKDTYTIDGFFYILSLMAFLLLIFSFTCVTVLKHEREANLRYRDRINAIRKTFLGGTKDPQVLEMLAYKKIDGYIETVTTKKHSMAEAFIFGRTTTAGIFVNFITFWACVAMFCLSFSVTSLLLKVNVG